MALLDNDVPSDAREITLDRLQACLAHYCIVKRRLERFEGKLGGVSLLSGLVIGFEFLPDGDLADAYIIVALLATAEPLRILATDIEYIYALIPQELQSSSSGL